MKVSISVSCISALFCIFTDRKLSWHPCQCRKWDVTAVRKLCCFCTFVCLFSSSLHTHLVKVNNEHSSLAQQFVLTAINYLLIETWARIHSLSVMRHFCFLCRAPRLLNIISLCLLFVLLSLAADDAFRSGSGRSEMWRGCRLMMCECCCREWRVRGQMVQGLCGRISRA